MRRSSIFATDKAHARMSMGVGAVCTALIIVVAAGALQTIRGPISSAETRFVEHSSSGMNIVPASCPSPAPFGQPGSTEHFAGDCSGATAPPTGDCGISADKYFVNSGDTVTLTWRATEDGTEAPNAIFNGIWQPSGYAITATAGAPGSSVTGSTTSAPTLTTNYKLEGQFTGDAANSFKCNTDITVCAAGTVANAGNTACICNAGLSFHCNGTTQSIDNCGNVTSCTGGRSCQAPTYQCQCPAGQSYNGTTCVLNGPTGSLTITPLLVASGGTVQISWNTQSTTSCTVQGTNKDGTSQSTDSSAPGVWSGVTGAARTSSVITTSTSYTMSCHGSDGSTLTQTVTVNLIPKFCEPGQPNCTP